MNSVLLVVAIILAVLFLWLVIQISQSQKKSSALESQLTELRRDLLSIAQTQSQSAGQIQSIGTSVSQRLESVTKALHDGVTNSAHIATQGQTAIAADLFLKLEDLFAGVFKLGGDGGLALRGDVGGVRHAVVKGFGDAFDALGDGSAHGLDLAGALRLGLGYGGEGAA